jgi:hypothetical protein
VLELTSPHVALAEFDPCLGAPQLAPHRLVEAQEVRVVAPGDGVGAAGRSAVQAEGISALQAGVEGDLHGFLWCSSLPEEGRWGV